MLVQESLGVALPDGIVAKQPTLENCKCNGIHLVERVKVTHEEISLKNTDIVATWRRLQVEVGKRSPWRCCCIPNMKLEHVSV